MKALKASFLTILFLIGFASASEACVFPDDGSPAPNWICEPGNSLLGSAPKTKEGTDLQKMLATQHAIKGLTSDMVDIRITQSRVSPSGYMYVLLTVQ